MSGGITSHKGQASWQGRGGGAGRKGKRSPGQRQATSPAPHVRRGAAARDGTAPSPLIALALRKERQHPISQCPSQEPQCCPAELQQSMPPFKDAQKKGTQVYLNLFLRINQFHLLHLSQTVAAATRGSTLELNTEPQFPAQCSPRGKATSVTSSNSSALKTGTTTHPTCLLPTGGSALVAPLSGQIQVNPTYSGQSQAPSAALTSQTPFPNVLPKAEHFYNTEHIMVPTASM